MREETSLEDTLILGVGNTLLSDEGAGIHALNLLQQNHPEIPDLTFVDGGTLSFTLASYIEDCSNLLILDAAELHEPAGTVRVFQGTELDDFLGSSKRSAHEVGLLDLMDIARLTGHFPDNRALIGIQPGTIGWGMQPTEDVAQALDGAVEEAVALIRLWQETASQTSTPLKQAV